MDATTVFVVGVIAAGILAAAGVFVVAYRRGPSAAPVVGELDREAMRRDRDRRQRFEAAAGGGGTATATLVEPEVDVETEPPAPAADPISEREPISEAEFGVTRRQFFNRSLLAIFGVFLAQFGIASLAFAWPKLRGGFGTPINAGNVADLRRAILQGDGTIVPLFVAAAQSWLVPYEGGVGGTSFESIGEQVIAPLEAPEPGLMALWQRCVHLGCRVPECISSQGFECPCHGSKYNFHGEYEDGPAPRNMDRFEVLLNDTDEFIINTGVILQTARSKTKTIDYPQGPSCL